MLVQAYLFFHGRCEEALTFYRQALGAEVSELLRFSDSPDPLPEGMLPPGYESKVMHCCFRIGETQVMASDGCSAEQPGFKGFSLSITLPSAAEADRIFTALGEGGQVQMPLGKIFWSPCFGIVMDRFGVSWMLNVIE